MRTLIEELNKNEIFFYVANGKLLTKAKPGAITSEIAAKIRNHKDELLRFFSGDSSLDEIQKIKASDNKTELKLSFAQQRLWLLDQINGGSAHYNMPAALKLSGELNTAALNQSFTTILERHEILRTCFSVDKDGEPIQVIQTIVPFIVPVIDLSGQAEDARQLQLTECINEEFGRIFNLSSDLMLRAQLIKSAADEHILLVNMHHIASDGWSIAILINEFSALYSAYTQGQENPLAPLAIQYADYAHWQRNWLQGEVLDKQLRYWAKQLAGLPVVHSLPLDHSRPTTQTFTGKIYSSQIDAHTSNRLNILCQSQGATVFMGLHAAFSVLLSRYSNEIDIVVGSAISNREQAEIAPLIGFFVNTLVLRSDLSNNPSFTALLNQSKNTLLDAYAHQQVPFEQIVERLQPERSVNHSALFQVMLVLQNNEQGTLVLPGLTLSPVEQSGTGVAKFDLTLTVNESHHGLQLGWEYNTDLFEQDTIVGMANHFELLLSALVTTPDENVFKVEMLSAQERQQLLIEWNNTQADYPKDKCIHELFQTQVENNPDAIAVIFENQQLTYGELNQQANQLAHYLINEKHVKPDTLVGICVERSLEMVIGILAILKAGGAYVPLDPEYPEVRLKYMLDDANLSTVLTQRHLRETTPVSDEQALCLDDENIRTLLRTQSAQNPNIQELGLTSSHLAYVIYTSGSTGNPKGVLIQQSNTVAFLSWAITTFSAQQLRCVLASTSVCFDLSIFEIFVPLSVGGSLVVIKDILGLRTYQGVHEISLINTVPSAAEALLAGNSIPASVKTINLAGEPLKQKIVDHLYSMGIDYVYDLYGPSEDTTYSTYILRTPDGASSIGKPIHNTQVYLLNQFGQLSAKNIAGELHIGGVGLARGYLNRSDLTAEKFIPNPFYDKTNSLSSERLYKTGDLMRWLPGGNLEFLGRIDHQVKIRGFRIELGEIENTFSNHADVKDVVVLAKESATMGDKRLVAYVVTDAIDVGDESDIAITARHKLIENLRYHSNKSLPDYMVPSAFVFLSQLPLTPNGKVDRKALPEPDLSTQQVIYVAPRTETEKILCEIWQEILGVREVGIHDNFFELGGHSLLVMKMLPRLQEIGVVLTARQIFLAPTVKELAASASSEKLTSNFKVPENLIPSECQKITPEMLPLIELDDKEISTIVTTISGGVANIQDIYPLGPLQQGILFHHMMSRDVDPYVLPLLFKIKNVQAVDRFLSAMEFVVARHDTLRTIVLWIGLQKPVQVVCRKVALPVKWIQPQVGQDLLAFMKGLTAPEAQYMDLTQAPLFEINLLADPEADTHFMLLKFHHLISDHVGLEILLREIAAFERDDIQSLEEPVAYREFIAYTQYQDKYLNATDYFTRIFSDIDEPTLLFNLIDVQGDGKNIEEYRESVPQNLNSNLRSIAKRLNVSPAVIFHAAWSILVSTCSGKTDIVFGTVLSGRLQGMQASQATVGVFMNTLPLRVNLSGCNVLQLINQIKESLAELLPYEQASLAIAQRCSNLPGDAPLFNAMLNYRHSESGNSIDASDTGFEFELISGQERTNFPFSLTVDDLGIGFELTFQVDSSLSSNRMMGYMQSILRSVLEALSEAPMMMVENISVLPPDEKNTLTVQFNDTHSDYPQNIGIHELFEAQVERTPEAIALVFEGEYLSYASLNSKANKLAHYLVTECNVFADSMIGICLERSSDILVAMLAVLKAGGAYVPMDPEYPESRLTYMLEDAGLQTVITNSSLLPILSVTREQVLCLDVVEQGASWQTLLADNLVREPTLNSSRNLAYVIYTSGSTGQPKGVMIEHRSVVNFLFSMATKPGIKPEDRFLAVTSTSFDIHVLELFLPLIVGGQVVVASKSATTDPSQLSELLRHHSITVMQATPATWKMLLDFSWRSATPLKVLCGGEALSDTLAQDLLSQPNIELWNMYGPTETSIWSSAKQIFLGDDKILIGGPIANTQFYVVNESLALSPIGLPGELLIGGSGLARGYLGKEELTASRFIKSPFYNADISGSSERLYRTGDLVRWLPDGQIEYLGRLDQQIKIRGFRVEPGEIENQIRACVGIKDAVVVAHNTEDAGGQLVCYFVGEDGSEKIEPPTFSLFYFGAHNTNSSNPYDFYLKSAQFADANGFEAIWTPERHFDPVGALYPSPSVLSAALAPITKYVHLRSGSVVMPLHDPIRIAEEWAIVDNLSNGRVGLAIASGWHSRDFVLKPDNFAERKHSVAEGISTLKTLWSGQHIHRMDGNLQPVNIEIFPKPVQSELPLWITAAGNPQTFIEAGRQGVHLLTHLLGQSIEELSSNIDLYRSSLGKHGHDPAKGKVSLMVHTYIGEELNKVLEQARVPFINYMRAHVALVKPLLISLGISLEEMPNINEEEILDFAYRKYTKTASLIGTVDSLLPTLEQIMAAGVNEVGCLIDWMDEDLAYEALPFIVELMQRSTNLKIAGQTLEKALRHELQGKLPGYMVPGAFFRLHQLPLTPNGKIDRKALPEPAVLQKKNFIAPNNETEKRLSEIWSEVLEVERVGLTDNFFQLGGHSLLAMKLLAKLKEEFNIDFAVDLFFELSDLESFAAYIDSSTLNSTSKINTISTRESEEIIVMENFTI